MVISDADFGISALLNLKFQYLLRARYKGVALAYLDYSIFIFYNIIYLTLKILSFKHTYTGLHAEFAGIYSVCSVG